MGILLKGHYYLCNFDLKTMKYTIDIKSFKRKERTKAIHTRPHSCYLLHQSSMRVSYVTFVGFIVCENITALFFVYLWEIVSQHNAFRCKKNIVVQWITHVLNI